MEDSKIIELLFVRNEDGIKHMDDTYGRRLFVLAERIVENDQDAEELVGDMYMKASAAPRWDPKIILSFLSVLSQGMYAKNGWCIL